MFTDVAIKVGLAKISEWAFRNVPERDDDVLVAVQLAAHDRARTLKTVYGGVEEDFAHSRATWYVVMKDRAKANGFKVLGESKWLLADTNFATQVREMKKANADIVAISAHPFTTCGVLKEMQRQGVKPKVLIGLDRLLQPGDAAGLRQAGRGHDHPDQLRAGEHGRRVAAAKATAKFKGAADLHSMAAWENMFILKDVMESREDHRPSPTRQGRPPQDPRRARQAEADQGPARRRPSAPTTARPTSPTCSCRPRAASGSFCTTRSRSASETV